MFRKITPTISRIQFSQCAVLIDVDETVLESTGRWLKYIFERMGLKIPLNEIKYYGSIDGYFINHPTLYVEYSKLADKFRSSKELNKDLPSMPRARKYLREISTIPKLVLGGYCSVRPLNIAQITLQNIQREGFPKLPLIARPVNVN